MENPHIARPLHGVVAVIPRGQRLLVIRRSQLVRAPGAFCFPGGAIEEGEQEAGALVREVDEELNVRIEPVRQIWASVTPWSVQLSWWLAELPVTSEPRPNPLEVESVQWMTIAEIRKLPELLESNHHFLDALARQEIRL
jgi:8-oxo-dGTP diphosphatase